MIYEKVPCMKVCDVLIVSHEVMKLQSFKSSMTHLNHKNKPISNFKEKANHFNSFFASQCTPVSNNSTLPLVTRPVTNASLSSISSNDQDILKIIHSLNINKAHGYHDISITLLKICDSSVVKPLSIIFKNCLQSGSFPNNWEIQLFYLFIKKVTRNLYKTIDLFLYFQRYLWISQTK